MEPEKQQDVPGGMPGVGGVATRIFAILGFVAIVAVGMWGSIKIASGVPGAFSSLAAAVASFTSVFVPAGTGGGNQISLSAPALTEVSGTPFTLSWTAPAGNPAGSYTFRYDCADGVYFTSPSPSGQPEDAYCNVPFNFLNQSNSITLTPYSTRNRFIDATIYVDFTPNGGTNPTVTGKTVITIENDAIAGSPAAIGTAQQQAPSATPRTVTPTAGPATTQTYLLGSTTPTVSNPNGSIDLTARIIEVGIVDKTSGVFTASSTPSIAMASGASQYRIAVRFAVENDGTRTSPQFTFNAVLPTMPLYIFSSPTQQALGPGDRIEYTLGFDEFNAGGDHVFTVNVDPTGSVNDANRANNIVHYTVPTTP